jgi:hypothetical protein
LARLLPSYGVSGGGEANQRRTDDDQDAPQRREDREVLLGTALDRPHGGGFARGRDLAPRRGRLVLVLTQHLQLFRLPQFPLLVAFARAFAVHGRVC